MNLVRSLCKICTFVGILLCAAGVLVFLLRPMGEGEGDARPIVLAQYAVWLFIAGGVICFLGAVFRYASDDPRKDKPVAKACRFVGISLLVAGAVAFLQGAQYAVWIFIPGGVICLVGTVFHYLSGGSQNDKPVA